MKLDFILWHCLQPHNAGRYLWAGKGVTEAQHVLTAHNHFKEIPGDQSMVQHPSLCPGSSDLSCSGHWGMQFHFFHPLNAISSFSPIITLQTARSDPPPSPHILS